MDDKTYRRMMMGCSCGFVARSMIAEALHRHNFPLLCKTPKIKKKVSTRLIGKDENDIQDPK